MTIEAIRFRTHTPIEDGSALTPLLILQVLERSSQGVYRQEDKLGWRDAAPTDLLDVAKFTADYRGLQRMVDEAKKDAQHVDRRLDQLQERLDLAKFPQLPEGDPMERWIERMGR